MDESGTASDPESPYGALFAPDNCWKTARADRFAWLVDGTEYLSTRRGMQAYEGSTLHRGDSPYGNLLLSTQAATAICKHDISVQGGEPRGAIEALFTLGSLRLTLFVSHLGLRAVERRQ